MNALKKMGQGAASAASTVKKTAGDGIQKVIDWIMWRVRCPDRGKNKGRVLGVKNDPKYWNYLILNHPESRG